jgi:hypothetical protein
MTRVMAGCWRFLTLTQFGEDPGSIATPAMLRCKLHVSFAQAAVT